MADLYNISTARSEEIASSYLRHSRPRPLRSMSPRELSAADHTRLSNSLEAFHGNLSLQRTLGIYLRESRRVSRKIELDGLLSNLRNVIEQYELDANQNLALDHIPEEVYEDVENILKSTPHTPLIASEDALAISLVRWFKTSFMRWVDPVKCPRCGGSTEGTGTLIGGDIVAEEREGGAGRVELYRCVEAQTSGSRGCGGSKRFPRYNNVRSLMRNREGRCGEFANLFTLFLRAVGLEARYIWNSEDHVWTEYWSEALGHWVHLDSCEGAWNKPLLYELGWGKKQGYCIAVGRQGVEDVTRCYVDDWAACWEMRRKFDEEDLAVALRSTTAALRSSLPPSQCERLAINDESQVKWKSDWKLRRLSAEADNSAHQGRQSGTKEWRAVRQELGLDLDRESVKVLRRGKVIFSLQQSSLSLQTSGSAAVVQLQGEPPQLSLTPCVTSRCGSAFAPPWDLGDQSFISDITFRISKANPSAEGADGMAFVCLRAFSGTDLSLLGGDGAGLGYSGLGGEGDWVVEVDTYQSQDSCADPPTPHVSLQSPPNPHHRHSVSCTAANSIPDISDSQWRTITIQYAPKTRSVAAWLSFEASSTMSTSTSTDNMDNVLLWQATLPSSTSQASDSTVYRLGLTAATGGFAQAHEVKAWVTYAAQ